MNVLQFIIDIAAKGEKAVIGKIHSIEQSFGNAEAAADRLARKTDGSLKKAIMSLPGAQFFSNPIVALTTGVGVVSKLGMEAEKTSKAFSVLVGNEKTAGMLLRQFNEYADNTVWDRPEIVDAAKTMLGFGVSTQSVYQDLKMLGDVAMGDKNKLQSLALVFGQISSAGKMSGQDLLQMINAGYNPLLDISELTGKSVATLKDEMSKGAISIDLVRQALEKATGPGGKFNGMIDTLAKSTSGAWEQLKGKLTAGLLKIYKIIEPMLIPAMELLGKLMEWGFTILEKIIGLLIKHQEWLLPVITALGIYKLAMGAATIVTNGFGKAMGVLSSILKANPIVAIASAIAGLITSMTLGSSELVSFGEKLDILAGKLERVWGIIKNLVTLDWAESWNWFRYGNKEGQLLSLEDKIALANKIRKHNLQEWEKVSYKGYNIPIRNLYSQVPGFKQFVWGWSDEEKARKASGRPYYKSNFPHPQGFSFKPPFEAQVGGTGQSAEAAAAGAGETANGIANDITTGGTRNTQITVNIGKFWEDVIVYQSEKADAKIYAQVVESVNRALEVALSVAR